METRDTYQAGQSADESATPEKVLTMRPYTKVSNDYYDALIGVVSPSAYYVLHFLIRQTCGFHRDTTRSSLSVIAEATNLSRHTVITALRELQDMHIVTSDGDTLTRTQIRTYQMQPAESWRLPSKTSAKIALVERRKRTSAKIAPVQAETSAENALDDAPTSAKIAPIKRKPESKEKREKENDANASSDANAPTPRKRSSRPRKLTDEQYTAKMREEEWKAALFAGMEAINGYPITGKGKERAAAHELYGYRGPKNRDSVLSVETILDCYRLTLIDPFYGQDQLSLQTILKKIGAYLNSPENFHRGMEEKRRKAEYVSNGANGHARASQPSAPPPSSPDTDDALTRKGIETRERLARIRREREAAEAAAAKGVQS